MADTDQHIQHERWQTNPPMGQRLTGEADMI